MKFTNCVGVCSLVIACGITGCGDDNGSSDDTLADDADDEVDGGDDDPDDDPDDDTDDTDDPDDTDDDPDDGPDDTDDDPDDGPDDTDDTDDTDDDTDDEVDAGADDPDTDDDMVDFDAGADDEVDGGGDDDADDDAMDDGDAGHADDHGGGDAGDAGGHSGDVHWGYSGDIGPEHWGELSEDYALCSTGSYQSPVDFPEELEPAELTHLSVSYASSPASLLNNGHTIVIQLDVDTNELMLGDDTYTLLQFHFHADSEHRVSGVAYPLEMHFVHQADDGELAVLGVFFEVGAENQAMAELFASMMSSSDEPQPLNNDVDLMSLLPAATTGWSYDGSLTTPPCTEGVKWNVHSEPITISVEQLQEFLDIHPGSYRPVLENASINEQLE